MEHFTLSVASLFCSVSVQVEYASRARLLDRVR